MVCVSITGHAARAMLVLAIIFAAIFAMHLLDKPLVLLVLMLSVLIPPTLIELFRAEGHFSPAELFEIFGVMFDRAFGRSIDAGIWSVNYAQLHGPIGWEGIGNLAKLLGKEPVNLFNLVGLEFQRTVSTVSSNTTYVNAYYVCFGQLAFVPCLILLSALDSILLVYPRIAPSLRLPCVACCQIAASNLCGTLYSALFVTYGFATIPLLCILFSYMRLPRAFTERSSRHRNLLSWWSGTNFSEQRERSS